MTACIVMKFARLPILMLLALLVLAGCSVLEEPERRPMPTPIPTARPFTETLGLSSDTVVDPVSDIVPDVDPQIAGLVDLVSHQQLEAYVRTLESFGTRSAFSDTESDTFGIGATRRWLLNEFLRVGNGRLDVSFDDFTLNLGGAIADQRNVVARLYAAYTQDGSLLADGWRETLPEQEPHRSRHVADFIAGMTDRYAIDQYARIFGKVPIGLSNV